jgi:hypothetical protein
MAYGAVHQPVIAVFYALTLLALIMWAADGWFGGELRYRNSLFLMSLIAVTAYGFFQIIPFGYYTDASGVNGIPRTISLAPFDTLDTSIKLVVLTIYFFVVLAALGSAARLRRLATVLLVFGFVYAFYAILQMFLSPTRIYGIYGGEFSSPFGSFVNRHDFAAMM